jgi:hypothetical protein
MFDHNSDHSHEHPKDRALAPDDPMLISPIEMDGDPLVMLDCIVEEYAHMGCGFEEIAHVFEQPFFEGTYGLTRLLGVDAVRRRIRETLARCGVLRVSTIETPDEAERLEAVPAYTETHVPLTIRGAHGSILNS